MTLALFFLLYGFGGAFLAFWMDWRYPSLRPGFTKKLVIHGIAAVCLAQSAPFLFWPLKLVATEAVAFAGLLMIAYTFLVGAWVIRAVVDYTNSAGGGGGLRDRV